MYVDIISMAQQARPKVIGHSEFLRASAISSSALTVTTPGTTWWKGAAGATLPPDAAGSGVSNVRTGCHGTERMAPGAGPLSLGAGSIATAAPLCAIRTGGRTTARR